MTMRVPSFTSMFALVRDRRFWQTSGQLAFVLALLWLGSVLWHNLTLNLQRSGIQVGLNFIQSQASFDIGEQVIAYRSTDSFGRALIVGFINTLYVTGIGIVLATLLGFLMGLARLSDNWLIEQFVQLYVVVFRNTPLLLQLFFWYFVGLANFPAIDSHTPLSSPIYLTNRGLAIAWLQPTAATKTWVELLILTAAIAAGLWHWRRLQMRQSSHGRVWLWSGGAIALGLVSALIITQAPPLDWDLPHLNGTELAGGLQFTPEFAALLLGITCFIASFIAEIVRSGFQAVPKGQWEAARSLGLKTGAILSQVVLPQALRVIIPPLTNQYVNLAKGTSLAIAIGYPDIYFVATTIFHQTGRVIEMMAILMAAYLGVNLVIVLAMNVLNSSLKIQER